MSRQRRLPDGGTTRCVDEYCNAWTELGKKVEKYFPGYVLESFDPDFRFVTHSPKPYYSSFVLNVEQINLLVSTGETK